MVKPCVLRRHVNVARLHLDDGQTRQSCEVVGDVTMCLIISFPIIRQGLELATKYGGGSVECRDMGWLLLLISVHAGGSERQRCECTHCGCSANGQGRAAGSSSATTWDGSKKGRKTACASSLAPCDVAGGAMLARQDCT